jgi:hypothetical protein
MICFLGFGWRALQRMLACWLPIQDADDQAGVLSLLVTWRHLGGQERGGALYIDCKLRRLDCASVDL